MSKSTRGAGSDRPGGSSKSSPYVGIRKPVFAFDEMDRLNDGDAKATLVEVPDPASGATFVGVHQLPLSAHMGGARPRVVVVS